MRIGLFSEVYKPYVSGVVTSVTMLKKSLEELGHQVYVVTINNKSNKYEYDEKEHVLRVPGIDSGIYNDFKISTIYPIKPLKIIKKWNLDIIHTHTEGSIGTYGRLLSKQFDIPIVHTYHTMYEDYIYLVTKGLFDKPAKKLLEYFTLFYCDKTVSELIVPTQKAYNLFKIKYGVNREINIIPTGIDVDKFDRRNNDKNEVIKLRHSLGIKDDDFVLLLVSRISDEQKNIKFLIDAHKNIIKKHKNIKFLIVGDGPDLENMKNAASKINDGKNFIFTGMVPQDKVALYYQLGNIFVTASKTETQGLTVIEGMAASLPVVCMDDDSFKIAVIDEYNGKFFKNKKEYVKAIFEIYEDKEKYNNMSKQAFTTSKQFSIKYYGERIMDVYKKALNKEDKTLLTRIKNAIKRV